jgi:hypothetical protein
MKPVACGVNWYEGYANEAALQIIVDEYPTDFIFEQKGNLYFAEKEGLAKFFYYEKPGRGYGGRTFTINMLDGSTKHLCGPWSSRAGVMNQHFTQSVDVATRLDGGSRTLWNSSHVTLAFALEAIKLYKGIELVVKDTNGEFIYVPQMILHPAEG